MKHHHLILLSTVLMASAPMSMGQYEASHVEAPATLRMRVERMQTRQSTAVQELVGTFERLAKDPTLISSKEIVDAIDQGDRSLKNTMSACGSLLTSLRAKAKLIAADPSFSDDQKSELLKAVESMMGQVEASAAQCALTIERLEGSYKAMAKWRTIYKTYLDLDGETKANEQLKTQVDEYVKALTEKPEPKEPAPADAVETTDGQDNSKPE